jgi:lipopolysaccharide transport system permease protein
VAPEAAPPPPAADRATPLTVRVEPTHGLRRILDLQEIWRYRDVAVQIAKRDITVRYRQTALGAAWAILQPVATMAIFWLAFGHLAKIRPEGASYPLFSLAGLVPWAFFANALLLGADSLIVNPMLVSKIYFPRIFIPAGVVIAGLVDLLIAFVILVVVALALGTVPPVAIIAVPLLVAIALAAALGLASALAALDVRYRDIKYVVPFMTQFWLFATPIAYPVTYVSEPWRTLWAINPMVGVVEGFRWAVLGTRTAPWSLIGVSGASALVILLGGLLLFHRLERRFADIL